MTPSPSMWIRTWYATLHYLEVATNLPFLYLGHAPVVVDYPTPTTLRRRPFHSGRDRPLPSRGVSIVS